jgi:hypothetical protein
MTWPTYSQQTPLPPAKAAINPDAAERLRLAGDLIHGKLERMPKRIARQYARGLKQIAEMLERLAK